MLNATINRYAFATLSPREDDRITIESASAAATRPSDMEAGRRLGARTVLLKTDRREAEADTSGATDQPPS
jgi:galactokinase/mevalonate kinase-like predicted kinase